MSKSFSICTAYDTQVLRIGKNLQPLRGKKEETSGRATEEGSLLWVTHRQERVEFIKTNSLRPSVVPFKQDFDDDLKLSIFNSSVFSLTLPHLLINLYSVCTAAMTEY